MTITKLHELILTRLYNFAQSHGYGEECRLNDLAAAFGETDQAKTMLALFKTSFRDRSREAELSASFSGH